MTPTRFEQINQLFDDAVELAPSARAAFLAQACAGDEELRREVESLLAAESSVGDFMAAPALKDAAALMTSEPLGSMVGKQLGHYQLLSFIGAGGMGEVYAARDSRIGRKVAIKLLPAAMARDADRLHRFEQEARAVGMLNHPNILTIHDVGTDESGPYLVSELLEGETLRERIKRGALPLPKVVDIALQITRGLAAAHESGWAHRDLKPENLFITYDGRVKILDFGLAKLSPRRFTEARTDEFVLPQIRSNPGLVMGTVSYMSPEQLRGEEADSRSDIFAFGVILFEMLTGERPFRGVSAAETTSAILTQETPELPAAIGAQSPGLERVIRRCLEKQPQQRFQSMSDLGFALEALTAFAMTSAGTSGSSSAAPSQQQSSKMADRLGKRGWLGWVVAGIFMLSTIGLSIAYFSRPTISSRIVPFTSFSGQKFNPVFSPDGNQIAFLWDDGGGELNLYVKLIDAGTPLRLATNLGNRNFNLAWSPDGRSVAFVRSGTEGGIFTVPALGGPERKLSEMTGTFAWSPDGKTLAISGSDSGREPLSLYLLSLVTGTKKQLTTPVAGSIGDTSPVFSPDGQMLAFIRTPGTQVHDIYLLSIAGGALKRLTFDNLELNGRLAWTADGKDIVFSTPRGGLPSLWRVSVTGGEPRRLPGIGEYAFNPSIARQGDRLAYVYNKIDRNIWRVPGPHSTASERAPFKLIASTRDDVAPQYSPDGKRIVFVSDRSGSREIWVCASGGQNLVQLTNFGGSHTGTPRWSPDGRHIAFDSRPEGRSNIYVISADGGNPRRISDGTAEDIRPGWSVDGQWIYFGSWRNGDWQIWKAPSGGGQAVPVTQHGGYEAFASSDGKHIYYTKREPGIWRIPVEGGEEGLVLDQGTWGNWALLEQGICLLDRQSEPQPVIKFFSFATRQMTPLAQLDKGKAPQGNLTASSDGAWVLYWQADQMDNDIMLVEGFH